MRSYKTVRIAKYQKKGIDSIISIPLDEFRRIIEEDPCLYWYEEVDEYFRQRQEKREKPNYNLSFVYNYKRPPKDPDINGAFIIGTDDIIVTINDNYDESIAKLKEIAEKLDANLYE